MRARRGLSVSVCAKFVAILPVAAELFIISAHFAFVKILHIAYFGF